MQLVALLDNIRSLYNVGSIFRTSDTLGVSHLYLCGLTGAPDNNKNKTKISKTSLGAEATVTWTKSESIVEVIKKLKEDGYLILALEQTSKAQPLNHFTFHSSQLTNKRIALIVGHELYGVSEAALELADYHIMIPMQGQKESLNVSVAFGIAIAILQ